MTAVIARDNTSSYTTVSVFAPVFPPIFPTLPALHIPSSHGGFPIQPDGTDPLLGGHGGPAGGRLGGAT
jgi:hypothetical protein